MSLENLPPPPRKETLKKYGLTQEEWTERVREQGGVCPICGKLPVNKKGVKRLVTDHLHIRGFRHMDPSQKRLFFRGCPCLRCNLMYLPVGISVEKAKNIVKYLEAYEKRKLEAESKSMPSSVLDNRSKSETV
jgi:hypothetical protein